MGQQARVFSPGGGLGARRGRGGEIKKKEKKDQKIGKKKGKEEMGEK